MREADQHHFRRLQRRRRHARFAESLEQYLPAAGQFGDSQFAGQGAASHALGFGQPRVFGGVGGEFEPRQPVRERQHIFQNHGGIGAGGILVGKQVQRAGEAAAIEDPFQQVEHALAVGEAEHIAHGGRAHRRAGGVAYRLVEQRQPVTHRTVGGARDQGQRIGLDSRAFARRHRREMPGETRGVHPPQVETLAAREHRDRDFARLRGGEHEFHALRGFFERLEKRVERRGRQHVHFIDDVDLETRGGWRVAHAVHDLADVVDAGTASGVHLQHIDVTVFADGDAMGAAAARLRSGGFDGTVLSHAIQRTSENSGGGRLADAAHAGEQPGMSQAVRREGIGQRAHQHVLADEVAESLGGGICEPERGSSRRRLAAVRSWGNPNGGKDTEPRREAAATRAGLVTAASFRI